MLGVDEDGPETVKLKVPSPPIVFLMILIVPGCGAERALENVQVTNPPWGTVKLPGVPEVHEEPVRDHPAGIVDSETL